MAEMFSVDFANWLLGSPVNLTQLKPTELSLEPIRADSLIFLQSDDLVLHLEFQTEGDPDIPFRMADYRLRLYRKFPNKEVRQIVIYLSKTNSELVYQNTFELPQLTHRFEVIRLWEQPTEIFLNAPGLFPFAVLSRTNAPVETLTQVAATIDEMDNRRVQSNVAASTAVLSGLLLNQEVIKRVLRKEIMRESVIYQEILAEGEQKGEKKAIERVALNLLREGMSVEQVVKVTELPLEKVQQLQSQMNSVDPQDN
jgi:predicted transposase/invertase (TIGR01784 family)